MKDEDDVNRYDGCHHSVEDMLRGRIPEIESFCAIVRNEVNYVLPDQTYLQGATLMADSTFFSIFDFPLLQGTPAQVLEDRDAAVVSEEFARHLFGDETPVGKSLTYNKKEVFEIRDPHKAGLPSPNLSTAYIFATGDDFFAYPNNYNYYVQYYKDTFQHGGVSMEEMLIPLITLHGKKRT